MNKQIIRILKFALMGAGGAMILFIALLLTKKVDSSDYLRLAIYLVIFGLINGGLFILFDYFPSLVFVVIHFICSLVMILFILIDFRIIEFRFLLIFYTFEILFTVYIIGIIICYINDIISGNKINQKLGIESKNQQMLVFLSKVFIVWGSVLFVLPDIIASVISFVIIVMGVLYLMKMQVKTKYSLYLLVSNSISIIVNLLLLMISIIVEKSGGNIHIGLFNGLFVTITNIILNIIIYIITFKLLKSYKRKTKYN